MLEKYLDAITATGSTPRSIATRRLQLTKFLSWLEERTGETDARNITPMDASEYRRFLHEEKKQAPNSVNTALSSIHSFCQWMVDEGILPSNPVAKVRRIETVVTAPRWLDRNEKHRVIRATQSSEVDLRDAVIVLTLLQTGLRVSELVELEVDDVTISTRSGHLVVRSGKGMKHRTVPIPKEARELLAEYIVTRRAVGTFLFEGQRDPKMTTRAIQLICTKIGERAKVNGLTPHVLRHTFAHDAIEAGISIDRVALMLGHSKLDTTMIYTRPSLGDLQKDVEKLSFT